MDNSEEIKNFANATIKNVEGLMNAIEKGLPDLMEQLKGSPEDALKLANEMKLAETSERICELKKQLKAWQ